VFDALEVVVGGGVELPGDAGDHDAGFEEESALEAQGALIVQEVRISRISCVA
jgi:hypothetical protein